jgi:hypothetical protein
MRRCSNKRAEAGAFAPAVLAHLKARGAFVDLPTARHTGDIDRVRELPGHDPSLANRIGEHEGRHSTRRRARAIWWRRRNCSKLVPT